MPTMPNGLKPVVSGYALDDPGGVSRTDVAGGLPRYALDWDRGAQRYNVTLLLDELKFGVWTAFYHHVIKKGSISFDMQLDSGLGVAQHSVNIVPGSYSASRGNGQLMVVSFVAEAENQVYSMSATDGANLVAFYNTYGAGYGAFLDALAQFANVDSDVLDF